MSITERELMNRIRHLQLPKGWLVLTTTDPRATDDPEVATYLKLLAQLIESEIAELSTKYSSADPPARSVSSTKRRDV